jgi:S-(hydroxymethyl)glutathione dehydrogenase / alcohol dehydrogenase
VPDVIGRNIAPVVVRAAVCRKFGEPLLIEDVELARPRKGEVGVEVRAVGVCHSDLTFMEGRWGGTLPAVYGHEVAGVVSAVGAGVTSVRIGDHVAVTLVRTCGRCFFCTRGEPTQCEGRFAIDARGALKTKRGGRLVQGLRVGGFAEQVTVPESQAVRIPRSMPLTSACLLSCAVATGVGAVRNTARVPSGASVAVVGAGGVGINSIQAAALAGARPIIAVDPSPSRQKIARRFGATHAIAPDRSADAVARLTRRGVDYAIVTSGNPAAVELGLGLARRAGTVVMVGMTASDETVAVNPGDVADAATRILGCKLGAIRPQVDIPDLVKLYTAGLLELDELVTATFPLERINEAIAATRRGEGLRNVVVM